MSMFFPGDPWMIGRMGTWLLSMMMTMTLSVQLITKGAFVFFPSLYEFGTVSSVWSFEFTAIYGLIEYEKKYLDYSVDEQIYQLRTASFIDPERSGWVAITFHLTRSNNSSSTVTFI